MIEPVAEIAELPLPDALALVRGMFDAEQIRRRQIEADDVVEYYRQSERAYRMFHSGEGALHIGLSTAGTEVDETNTDKTNPDDVGHRRHVELFAEQIEAIDAQQVIEFGSGLGYNVRTLAGMMPQRQFVGVDLSPHHTRSASRDASGTENVQFVEGNYQRLDFPDASFDAVLAIETLCQTGDQRLAVAEAFRLLRPGGRMMVIDCFRNQPLETLDDDLREAAELVEKTAAVDGFALIDEWRQMAGDVGFALVDCTDRSHETARDLQRLYRLARRFFKMSLAVKLIRRAMPERAMENAVCGLLMPYTVGHAAHGYYTVVLEKPLS